MGAWLFLLLSSCCSLAIVHLLKVTETGSYRTLNTLTVNYLVGGTVALLFGWENGEFHWFGSDGRILLLFTVFIGAIFIANFLVYSKSVHSNGMGVSVTTMRLSLMVPVLLSILIYNETVTFFKIAGLVLVILAIGLLVPKKRNVQFRNIHAGWLLVILFLFSGLADASLKIYEEDFSLQINELWFMGGIFLSAFLMGLFFCAARKGPLFTGRELLAGTLIGIPNLYSSIFLIYALKEIDGAVAYPVVNVLNVVGGTILGRWFWKDHVSRLQWIGITVALIAILILL